MFAGSEIADSLKLALLSLRVAAAFERYHDDTDRVTRHRRI